MTDKAWGQTSKLELMIEFLELRSDPFGLLLVYSNKNGDGSIFVLKNRAVPSFLDLM